METLRFIKVIKKGLGISPQARYWTNDLLHDGDLKRGVREEAVVHLLRHPVLQPGVGLAEGLPTPASLQAVAALQSGAMLLATALTAASRIHDERGDLETLGESGTTILDTRPVLVQKGQRNLPLLELQLEVVQVQLHLQLLAQLLDGVEQVIGRGPDLVELLLDNQQLGIERCQVVGGSQYPLGSGGPQLGRDGHGPESPKRNQRTNHLVHCSSLRFYNVI